MKINKFILVVGLLTLLEVLATVTNIVPYPYVAILRMPLLLLPGWLCLKLINHKFSSIESLVLSLGLSIEIIMLVGLLLNWSLPILFHINRPLMDKYIVNALVLLCASITVYIFNKKGRISYQRPNILELARSYSRRSVFLVFPILAILGAIRLNNGASDILTMTLLFLTGLYIIYAAIKAKNFSEGTLAFSLFCMSAAVLFTISLRSWHINGWDINSELYVARLTQTAQRWNISAFRNPYNACLSITILPTIISNMFHVGLETVYRVIFQVIFSTVPVTVFLISRRLLSKGLAFLATVYFIAQPELSGEMTALNRQEIGFLFFSLLILLFITGLKNPRLRFLFYLLSAGMIVSHYSTTFMALLIIGIALLIKQLMLQISKYKSNLSISYTFPLGFLAFIILCCFTFLWYAQATSTSNGIFNFIQTTISTELNSSDSKDSRSEVAQSSLLGTTINNQQVLNQYLDQNKQSSEELGFSPQAVAISTLQVKNQYLWNTAYALKTFVKFFTLLGIPIWIIIVFLRKVSQRTLPASSLFLALTMAGLMVLLAMVIFPGISVGYGVERGFQQDLIFMSACVVGGMATLLKAFKFNAKYTYILISVSIAIYFWVYQGFASQLLGGQFGAGQLRQLNNFGKDYDLFYTHQSEVDSAKWLQMEGISTSEIAADKVAALRLTGFGGYEPNSDDISYIMLPGNFRNRYVYLDYSNYIDGLTFVQTNVDIIPYQLPAEVLNSSDNMVYDNSQSVIYN